MLQGLSYPSLRVVLENLEASKKFRISARCSVISRIDKTVPLRINHLHFSDNAISLNRIIFFFDSINVRETEEQARRRIQDSLTPGDILLDYTNDERIIKVEQLKYLKYSDDYNSSRQRYTRRLPENVTASDALKTLSNYILEQRKDIIVGELNIWNCSQKVLRLPQNIQFRVRGLQAAKNDVRLLKPIVDPSCFPLAFILVKSWKEEYLEDSFLQSPKKLLVYATNNSTEYWLATLSKIKNPFVTMRKIFFSESEVLSIIRNMIESGVNRKTTRIELDCKGEQFLEKLMKKVKKRFSGNVVNFKDELKTIAIFSNIVSISLDSDTELIVHGFQYEKNWNKNVAIYLRLQVFNIGLCVPIEKKKFLGLPWFS
ncbi:hypothetical protein GCK72_007259 [Caenorhabditis remanei]|uniref:DUF38 domain-containing protein n=1 Tax=Caenorhabditis remanei TaxID=31234 RepID=A0A6A5HGX1_CAERE|nr:hypothetical protein GCK72_007259 [Caenorhabditis remanei]KAF1767300.1 hypothetical protein GCK72_007259 [Caenorhabditis remanei]